jgi:tRNA A37 threonylcarbamoyladenosine dehydratase
MKIADPDDISGSNLNRVRYNFTSVGKNKCDIAAQQIYQINPYAELSAYREGITLDNIDEFLSCLDVLVEELDDLEMKIRLRLKAKEYG